MVKACDTQLQHILVTTHLVSTSPFACACVYAFMHIKPERLFTTNKLFGECLATIETFCHSIESHGPLSKTIDDSIISKMFFLHDVHALVVCAVAACDCDDDCCLCFFERLVVFLRALVFMRLLYFCLCAGYACACCACSGCL